MKNFVMEKIKEHKLIAIVRGVEAEKCIHIAQALYDGGFRLMEITYDQSHPETWKQTAESIGAVAKTFEGRMCVGAGTVTCAELVTLTKEHGGQFIISPNTDLSVIARTLELGLVSVPGALTPTEIMIAHNAGADFVKLFPAGNMGLSYMKSVRAPISHVGILATGGIDENNVADYLAAGAVGAGIGSNLVNKKWVEAGEYEKITEVARLMVEAIK